MTRPLINCPIHKIASKHCNILAVIKNSTPILILLDELRRQPRQQRIRLWIPRKGPPVAVSNLTSVSDAQGESGRTYAGPPHQIREIKP
jgi:hypothetical protein